MTRYDEIVFDFLPFCSWGNFFCDEVLTSSYLLLCSELQLNGMWRTSKGIGSSWWNFSCLASCTIRILLNWSDIVLNETNVYLYMSTCPWDRWKIVYMVSNSEENAFIICNSYHHVRTLVGLMFHEYQIFNNFPSR